MKARHGIQLAMLVAVVALTGHSVGADTVTWDVYIGSSGSFGFSYIHSASSSHMKLGGMDFYANGTLLFELSCKLRATIDDGPANKVTFLSSDITAKVLDRDGVKSEFNLPTKPAAGELWSLEITAGMITDSNGLSGHGAAGTLDYRLLDTASAVKNSGTWHFFDQAFGDLPNTIGDIPNSGAGLVQGELGLWGNNWDNSTGTPSSPYVKLGIDLGAGPGSPQVVPIPAAVWPGLLGFVLLGGRTLVLRRRMGA